MSRLHRHSTINESVVKRDKKTELFDYSGIAHDAWMPIIKTAQDFQNINFDLENNDTMEKRTLFVKKDLRVDQPVKYEINLELMCAGGDWEMPVLYFKAEITHHYGLISKKYQTKPEYVWDLDRKYSGLYRCFVLIPDNDNGNILAPTEKGFTAYTNETAEKDGIASKDFKIDVDRIGTAWTWVIDLFENAINERHEMLDKPSNEPQSDVEPNTNENLSHIASYKLFEGMDPVKNLTDIILQNEVNPQVKIYITVDMMNRITDVRSPGGIRHIFRRGNIINKSQMENWMETNGFVEAGRRETKKALKGNELIKFMMKKGYR